MENKTIELIKKLITASVFSRDVSILEAGNELATLLPTDHPNVKLVQDVAWEMHRQFFDPTFKNPLSVTLEADVSRRDALLEQQA